MHISAMLKFLGLSCDIIVYLFLLQVLFTAVILQNFCYLNKNIFWNTFLWEILVGSFAESCLPAVYPAESVRGLWKIGL
jgi:predicted lysophospholipase L1 biosynthesis ABC-type transport system permease subunit